MLARYGPADPVGKHDRVAYLLALAASPKSSAGEAQALAERLHQAEPRLLIVGERVRGEPRCPSLLPVSQTASASAIR